MDHSGRGAVRACPPGKLVCRLRLPVVAQSPLFARPWERHAGRREIREVAAACDRAGFFYVGVCDHIAIPRSLAPRMSTVWYDLVATLGSLAACTERVRLLTYVLVPAYRYPLALAKALCTIDALSGGRLLVAVGAGHVQEEFAALGLDFQQRRNLLDEAIAAFTAEFPEHRGHHWQFADMGIAPRPPIWVGGSALAALHRAARYGDGWLPQGEPSMGMAAAIEFLRAERKRWRGGRPLGSRSQYALVVRRVATRGV